MAAIFLCVANKIVLLMLSGWSWHFFLFGSHFQCCGTCLYLAFCYNLSDLGSYPCLCSYPVLGQQGFSPECCKLSIPTSNSSRLVADHVGI